MNNLKILQDSIGVNLITRFSNQSISQTVLPRELAPLADKLFTHPHRWPDGIVRTPLIWVSEYLRNNGVAPENIRAGHLVHLALYSVKLGLPLTIILTAEDPTIASHLLCVCKKIVPDNLFHEVYELKSEELYKDQEFFRDKVIICHDIVASKKVIPDLIKIFTQGHSTRQVSFNSKFGTAIKNVIAKNPKALIGVETTDRESILNHPSIIKVPVGINSCHNESDTPIFPNAADSINNIASRTVATIFERLRNRHVSIPYLNQIVRIVAKQKPENFREKVDIIRKVISLCSIINDPPRPTQLEAFAKYIGVKADDIERTMVKERDSRGLLQSFENSIFEANKVDYYLATMLLDGVIGLTKDSYTGAQIKVFEAVKVINFNKLNEAAINQNDVLEKLLLLPRFPKYWAYMHEIMKSLNKSNHFSMTIPNIETAIAKLIKLNMLRAKKGEPTNGNGYFILVPELKSLLKLPKRLKIYKNVDEKQSTKLLNPLTKTVEEL